MLCFVVLPHMHPTSHCSESSPLGLRLKLAEKLHPHGGFTRLTRFGIQPAWRSPSAVEIGSLFDLAHLVRTRHAGGLAVMLCYAALCCAFFRFGASFA